MSTRLPQDMNQYLEGNAYREQQEYEKALKEYEQNRKEYEKAVAE